MRLIKKESYNHGTTLKVEWRVFCDESGLVIGTYKTKKAAQEMLDACTLTKEQFKAKYASV